MIDRSQRDPALLGASPPDEERISHRRKTPDPSQARQFAVEAACLLHNLHFEDVQVMDLRGLSDLTDYVLIASGTSERQIRSVASEVHTLAKQHGLGRFGRDVDQPTTWVVLDFVDVIVHLFEPEARAYYDLEMLWGDAPQVIWQRHMPTDQEV